MIYDSNAIKLRLSPKDAATLDSWLWNLTGVWNWAVRKILDAKDGIYYSPKDFQNLLANHGEKMGIPSHTLQGMLAMAHTAWKRCFQKIANKPRLKGEAMKDSGGELTVKSERNGDAQLLVSVSDTGPGVPAEKVDEIFNAFVTTKP